MTQLRSLQESAPDQHQPLNLSPSAVKRLSIIIAIRSSTTFRIDKADIAALLNSFKMLAPNVQNLRFQSPLAPPEELFRYACSLKSLHALIITYAIPYWQPSPSDVLLEKLSRSEFQDKFFIRVDRLEVPDDAVLNLMKTGEVNHLVCRMNFEGTSILRRLNQSEWGSLQTMTLHISEQQAMDSPYWEGIGFSLPRVTRINMVPSGSVPSSLGLTALCQEIAIRPHSFPALEYLSSDNPEWDLLFIMLERRNFLLPSIQLPPPPPGPSLPPSSPVSSAVRKELTERNLRQRGEEISRIKCLNLVRKIGIRILRPLTDLLGGRYTMRPTNYELSFAGIAEAYLDPTM